MKTPALFTCALLLAGASAFAQSSSTSASFTLLHAPAGDLAGGGRVANAGATVVADISVGDAAAGTVSAVTAGGVQAKGNLIGQLYDPRTMTVTATPPTIAEGGARPLLATATLDDATTLPLTGLAVWDFTAPLTAIDQPTAVATAGSVFQNTQCLAIATYRGLVESVTLTVLNVNPDNFGTYGGDGLDDDWQVLHFGQPPNANAAPTADPDFDGRNNRFEFLSGFLPTDPASFFRFTITGFSAANVMDFRVNKAIPGRTYTLQESPNLTAPFVPVGSFSVNAEETNKLVQDTGAPSGQNFYRIEIAKP